jgi:acid-sensing ion channel, other
MKVESHLSGFRSNIRLKKKSAEIDDSFHESQVYGGVRYLFHSPYDLFSKTSIRHQSMPTFRVLFFIEPQQTKITEALKNYAPERRGCYLPNEKVLKFFKKFSKENCRSECLANKTLEVCGCVQFFMVREISTRICGIHEMKCYQKVEADLSKSDPCHCLLECEEIVYKFEVKQMEIVVFVF